MCMFCCSTWLRLLLLCRGPTFPSTLRCLPQLSQWRWVSGWLQINSLVQLIRWALLIENVGISCLGPKSTHNFLSAFYSSFTRPDSSLERVFKFSPVWVPNTALQPSFFWRRLNSIFVFVWGHPVIMTSYPSREWWRRLLHRAFLPRRRTVAVSNRLWAWTTPAITRPPTLFSPPSEFERHFTLIRWIGESILFPYAWFTKHTTFLQHCILVAIGGKNVQHFYKEIKCVLFKNIYITTNPKCP